MQQVRVYQSVLRKPQLAKCFTLRQSTENKAGRETYLCFHPFNYNALTPPSPQTVPSGGFAGDVLATHFSGGLSPLLKGMQKSVSGAQAPHAQCEEHRSIRRASKSVNMHCPEAGWSQRRCKQLPGTTLQKGSRPGLALQSCLPDTPLRAAGWRLSPASTQSGSCF